VTAAPRFEWDDANIRHLARHGVTAREFEEAMLGDPIILHYDNIAGEDRWLALGATAALRVLALAFTVRHETIRAVTAYRANKKLAPYYWEQRGW
jgi:hypothetical protein